MRMLKSLSRLAEGNTILQVCLPLYSGNGTDAQVLIYHPIPPLLDLQLRETGFQISSTLLLYSRGLIYSELIKTMIDSPKPLIAAVNGSAISTSLHELHH